MMLDVQGLRTGYGRIPILNGVSFSVNEGEFIGILGHNGMGKTTLLKALMGFLPATGGRVLFGQDDVTALEPYRRARLGLGYVPQGREIFPGLSVHDNLRMGCSKQAGDRTGHHRRRAGAVSPPESAARSRPAARCRAANSNCWRSRAACAASRVWCCSTSPRKASSPPSSTRSSKPCSGCAPSSGLTMILVEQNLDFIAALSQRILIIQKGTITREVQPGDLADASLVGEFVGIAT